MEPLTPEQLKSYLDRSDSLVLLDVREPWEYEICHIEGSTNISMSRIPAEIDELDSEKATVVICHHGARSEQIANYLESQGFTNISNLEGGIDAWAKTVDSSMPQY